MPKAESPNWYPLCVDEKSRQKVYGADGYEFAVAVSTERAALIVLTLNEAVRRDFGVE